jgi:hypothetical protein
MHVRSTRQAIRRARRIGLHGAVGVLHLGFRILTERHPDARRAIQEEVLSWPGVTSHRHRFGGLEFRVGRRELGHIHADHLVDLPFPVKLREQLVAEGRARVHHILPDSGWVSFPIRRREDIPGAIELFRLAWTRASASASGRHVAGIDGA